MNQRDDLNCTTASPSDCRSFSIIGRACGSHYYDDEMGSRLDEFRKRREQANEKILASGHLGIKRFFGLDGAAYKDGALSGKTKELLDTLSLLLLHPGEEFYQREIAERIGRTVVEVQRALRRVESAGLATRSQRGNRVYYTANRNHPAFRDLKSLLLKTSALGDALRRALATIESKIAAAFIFGSFAVGTESPYSDIDLLVVGTLSSREASRLLGSLGRKLRREFNPIVYTVEDLRSRMKSESPFIEDVLRGPKIWLIGDDDELERLLA